MTTTRAVGQTISGLLEQMLNGGVALEVNALAITPTRVSWQSAHSIVPFLASRHHATVGQYVTWLNGRHFSVVMNDGGLLQITYDVAGGVVSGHRLAYVPCPFLIDQTLLDEGLALDAVVELYRDSPDEPVLLQSPIRFDYDPRGAKPGHAAAHMTINSADCRIACVAPMHVLRFADFILRHFYPTDHERNAHIFSDAASRHLAKGSLLNEEEVTPHLMWRH